MVHSLYQSLNNLETIYADRIGIRYYDEAKGGVVEVPFRQYAADLRRFVAFLRSRTPNPLGQRVAILARNSYHYVMCMYGAVLAGAVAVPLNTGKNWDEIRYELDLVEPVCVLHDGEYLSREPALGQEYGDRLVPMDAFTAFEPAMEITEVPGPQRNGLYHVHLRHHWPQQGRYAVSEEPVHRHACLPDPL